MTSASVELLTAEVRTLMIGKRQVTMSVFKQLDTADPADIEPLGRVKVPTHGYQTVNVVGRHRDTGVLVAGWLHADTDLRVLWREWNALPLIVLAGLR